MVVKQMFAGWIGVAVDGVVVNESIGFKATPGMLSQLKAYKANDSELARIEKGIKANNS